tara:strand:+ start:13419 stop:15413 length:1995 start_codon:yes stop_codon:yes gene_type:complete
MKSALITGVTGMDGSHLVDILLDRGYEVHGLMRRSASPNLWRIQHALTRINLIDGDMTELGALMAALDESQPDIVLNMAGQSFVPTSFRNPAYTYLVNTVGVANLIEAMRKCCPDARMVQASSSEMFGNVQETPQTETTRFYPRSPYGVSKAAAFYHVVNARESKTAPIYGCNSICFNHEGERRGTEFVTRKITLAVARIHLGLQDTLALGNLDARRDWGYAKEYCLPYDVPILTPRGWRFVDDIEDGDEVINFCPKDTGHLSRDKVLKVIRTHNDDGNWVLIQGRGVHLRVTPEHRIYYQRKSSSSKGGWSAWKICSAREFVTLLENKSVRRKYDIRLPHFQDYDAPDLKDVEDELLYFMGVLLAEGSLSSRPQNRGLVVSCSQSRLANPGVYDRIESCALYLGLKWRSVIKNDGCKEWLFDAPSSKKILQWFDVPNVHLMPNWLFELSGRQANILFTALMDCDGCWGTMTYMSTSPLLLADVQTIAHLAGYRTSAARQQKNGMWSVTAVVKRKKYLYAQSAKLIEGEQEAWCVKTVNGTIVSRDAGCISISGNCEGMLLMLEQDEPDDYIVATGVQHSIRDLCREAFAVAGIDDWESYIKVDPRFVRPSDVELLQGDASKAKRVLGWEPSTSFRELVQIMVEADVARLEGEDYKKEGRVIRG